jgi:NAD-dependent protein deacetylase/lipoamidase
MGENTASLAKLIRSSDRIVVFTGAGISTESGIPDFRSPNGIWSKQQPIQFQDFVSSAEMRAEAWRRKIVIDRDMRSALPNRGHRAVAALVKLGKCNTVITQNIDGLHQASGIADENIVELHGNGTYATCLECGRRHELAPIFEAFDRDGTLPTCGQCGGLVKTATVSFGQSMPLDAMERAERAALTCGLFIVLGSSLVVHPAAGFPAYAKQHGAQLVIINREATDQDPIADLVLHGEIGPTLGDAVNVE